MKVTSHVVKLVILAMVALSVILIFVFAFGEMANELINIACYAIWGTTAFCLYIPFSQSLMPTVLITRKTFSAKAIQARKGEQGIPLPINLGIDKIKSVRLENNMLYITLNSGEMKTLYLAAFTKRQRETILLYLNKYVEELRA